MRYSVALGMIFAAIIMVSSSSAQSPASGSGDQPMRVDHFVPVRSKVPSMVGQIAQIYVRERFRPGTVARAASVADRVVLFVHGAGTPAEVAFDVPYRDYSWMAFLAQAGFDVFAMDTTGYGRSTRPTVMNDPCNLAREQQAALSPSLFPAPCAGGESRHATTIESDWNDIDAVVDYIRAVRRTDRIHLIGWSLGGPRAAGYAARHSEKVQKLVLLAPAYTRDLPASAPAQLPAAGPAMNTQSRAEFDANWERQVGCPEQVDPSASDSVWSEMIQSDPVGATWGTGVRRAPQVTTWGWNAAIVAKTQIPMLAISGEHDKQVLPQRVQDLYADLPSHQKIYVQLACSSHNAMWESNHLLLFRASLEWLTRGSVNGKQEGILRLGTPTP